MGYSPGSLCGWLPLRTHIPVYGTVFPPTELRRTAKIMDSESARPSAFHRALTLAVGGFDGVCQTRHPTHLSRRQEVHWETPGLRNRTGVSFHPDSHLQAVGAQASCLTSLNPSLQWRVRHNNEPCVEPL